MNKLQVSMAAQLLAVAYEKVARVLLRAKPQGCCRVREVPQYSDAPQTLSEMLDCIGDNAGVLLVASEGGESSIYGKRGNTWFRMMHDLGHVTFMKDTTYADELSLSFILWQLIADHIPSEYWSDCARVYQADTIGQSMYCDLYGEFPEDQQAFVQAMCKYEQARWGLEGYRECVQAVHAALAAQNAPDLREFACAVLQHNVAVRRVADTRRRLLLAANRFMRAAQYPYGPEVLLLERLD